MRSGGAPTTPRFAQCLVPSITDFAKPGRSGDSLADSADERSTGLRDPDDAAAYEEDLAKVTIGGPRVLTGRIEIREYDPAWPDLYAREAERIRVVLGDRVVRLEHGGSTSVPGLPAKPIIDIVLEV